MTGAEWAGVAAAAVAVLGGLFTGLRWLIKAYLAELKPNGGSSMNDRLNRLEIRVDEIYRILTLQHRD